MTDTQYNGPAIAVGSFVSDGLEKQVVCGFAPAAVELINATSGVVMRYNRAMADGYGFKSAYTGSGFQVYAESDIKGSANTDSEVVDGASLPTNANLLFAAATFGTSVSPIAITTNPDIARNIVICVLNDSGGTLNLYTGTTTFTVTGTYKGAAQTEAITITATVGTKTIADSKFRYKYGSKPFDKVTAIAYDNSPDPGLKIAVGIGSKIALPNALFNASVSSVTKTTKNAADYDATGLIDATNNTVNFAALSNGDDISVTYKSALGAASLVTSGGVTRTRAGFTLGTDADVNANTNTVYWTAHKF